MPITKLTTATTESKMPENLRRFIEAAIKTTTTRDLIPAQEMQDALLEIYSMLQSEQAVPA